MSTIKNNKVVDDYCQYHHIKLTPLRRNILNILLREQQPLTAYAILDKLKETNPKAQAMSVYRILEFLLQHHLVHRIENLNAFIVCYHLSEHNDTEQHFSQWLICEQCGDVQECIVSDFEQGLTRITDDTGFRITVPTIELLGVCRDCQREIVNT